MELRDLAALRDAEDPMTMIRRDGEPLKAPRFEGWFHDTAETYLQYKRRVMPTGAKPLDELAKEIIDRSGVQLSIFTYSDRAAAGRINAADLSESELLDAHASFFKESWHPDGGATRDAIGAGLKAWAQAYADLLEKITPQTALVIAWDGRASFERVQAVLRDARS